MEQKSRVYPAVLLLDSDEQHAGYLQNVLQDNGFQVTWVDRHLVGLSLLDDQDFPLILATVEGQDITGFELCFLLRHRQERGNTSIPAVVLMGRERDREELAASDPDTNDYLIEPCLDVEIIWRLRRNIKVGMEGSAQLQGLQFPWCALNKNDLYSVLLEEVNRGNRRSDSMGLVLIKVTGWSLLSMDYGPGVAQVVEDIILSRIQGIIRSYDAVFRIDQGRFVLLLPHTDRDGLTTFVRRVHNALHTILGNEAFAQDELEVVHVEGICVWTYSQSRPQTEAVKKLHAYIVKKVLSDRPGSDYVCIHLGAEEGTSVLRGNDCGESS